MELEGADAGGQQTEVALRGDEALVQQRRMTLRRRTAAIQAHLDQIAPLAAAPVQAAQLAADRQAVERSGSIAPKTAGKVATDEHSFDMFVAEQRVQLTDGEYPSVATRRG